MILLADAAIFAKFLTPGPHHPDADQPRAHRQGPDIYRALRNEALAHRDRGAAAIAQLLHDFTLSVTSA